MKSRGYFSEEDWEVATRRPVGGEGVDYVGGVNITYLDVDGIIPESSFGIEFEDETETEIVPFFFWGLIIAILSTLIISSIINLLIKKQPIEQKRINFRSLVIIIFVICLALSFVISWFLWINLPESSQAPILDSNYNAGIYVRYKTTGSILTNDLIIANNISRISGRSGFVDYENELDWVSILGENYDEVPRALIEEYNLEFAIENKMFSNRYYAYDSYYYSRFYISLEEERYKIYENTDINIWFVFNDLN
jgi:hypothetical protein